jgi:hypothetical protein
MGGNGSDSALVNPFFFKPSIDVVEYEGRVGVVRIRMLIGFFHSKHI